MGQIALALVLLIGAGLFVRTLGNLRAQGPGFETTNLLTFRVDPGRNGYATRAVAHAMRDLLAALRSPSRGPERRNYHRRACWGWELERAAHHRSEGRRMTKAPSTAA